MARRLALVIRHTPAEGIASFRLPIEAAGYDVRLLSTGDLRSLGTEVYTADLLVTMGGPMGVYERDAYPWIADELHVLRERIGHGGPTLGVCLGAQMIATSLGARVYKGPVQEIGFAPITLEPAGEASPLRHLAGVPVLHWHGDTFDLPAGATLLARTASYAQAFSAGAHVLAIQCHPEMGEDPRIGTWIAEGERALQQAGTSGHALLEDYRELGPRAVAAGRQLAAEWLSGLAN